jgi:hypothetical protein
MRKTLSSFMCIAILAACQAPADPDTAPILSDYHRFDFGTSRSGNITYYLDLQERDGMTALCGTVEETVRNNLMFLWFQGASVRLRGEEIQKDLRFILNAQVSEKANCVLIDRPWEPGYQNSRLSVRFPDSVSWTY